MILRRALALSKGIRLATRLLADRSQSTAYSSSSSSFLGLTSSVHRFGSGLSMSKTTWGLVVGIILSGQTVFVSLDRNPALAEEGSVVENDQGQGYSTGLRRIEDGSVISNSHTSKWRIFTDNGREFFLKGKLDEAEKYFLSALHEAKEGFGPRDAHVASSCNNLAELYRVRKDFEKAEPLYLEAVRILEESFGPDDIRVGAALHNLGQFYLVQRKLEQAQTCYERALKIKGRVLGYGHTDYADTMYHLGMVLYLRGNEKDSEALIQESIRIMEEAGQGETTTCIRRMRYLSQMLLKSNQLAEAEILQRKILHILEMSKAWDSMDTVIAAESLALTLQSLGNLKDAQELLERCLDVRRKMLGEDHIQVAANMLHLARIALLNSNQLRKVKIADPFCEVERAKLLLDNSVRIAKASLDHSWKGGRSLQSSRSHSKDGKDEHAALIILMQSLDAVGLWEIMRREFQDEAQNFPLEVELALRKGITIIKEEHIKVLLQNYPDARAEALSCLKHLINILNESAEAHTQNSGSLQELKDEVRHIEADLSPKRFEKRTD